MKWKEWNQSCFFFLIFVKYGNDNIETSCQIENILPDIKFVFKNIYLTYILYLLIVY